MIMLLHKAALCARRASTSMKYSVQNITVYLLDHQHRTVYEIEGSYKLHSNGKTTFFIDTLSEGPDKIRLPGIKAWQFYKWLITDKDFILVSDDVQTAGGQAVWDTLIRDPAVALSLDSENPAVEVL